ncbi:glycosyltransferase family 2 protein [Campylobacter jejuni]|uniref:glycosyltransferase n=1 Tax=Campylobacter TaxID=194 RepID=UPI00069C25F0|nr:MULTISPECIES: glycosyltransferase family 2 protein [Campylobacter]ECP6146720.1 glycosyltransferase family 2 protein [Campylobacter jejuni]ECZ4077135.1 glycosyltransferase family 2 protein [Campylobacter jejuni]EEP3531246.1 glycosyltransferase family 2 protein [Campylobacter jejuni]OEW07604.1 glycosyl transferase family A [Campylobacter sp. BCW_6871]RTJ12427.1 glycosyl transferase family A [Campylobacter jejuni]
MVSIIIPIYNVEKYLDECLKSVINQSYKDLDIILVDDGSTDNSLNIAKKYAKKDERIFIIAKENGGLSSARNAGLEFIKGTKLREFFENENNIISYESTNTFKKNTKELTKEEINKNFIKLSKNIIQTKLKNINEFIIQDLLDNIIHFLDSDDYLEPTCIEKCVNEMNKSDLDLIAHSFKEFIEEEKRFKISPECDIILKMKNLNCKNGLELLLQNECYEFYFAWQGAFRASLLNTYKLRFAYGIYHEDHDFGTILFFLSPTFFYLKEELMVYRIRQNSITNIIEDKIPKKLPENLEKLRKYFESNGGGYKELRAYFKAYCMCVIGVNIFLFCKESNVLDKKFQNKIFLHYIHYYIEQYYPLNYLNIKDLFSLVGINLRLFRFKLMLRFYFRHPRQIFRRNNA